ncbi:6-pyruvoyl trahydropterin synthase family protein [Nonomuraea recticatena]|uniref:6-carboxy-5,6,7,8-tetrahydropterin synthase n=1 Tax=Nonomuraea recticatena TaxID=46178 RepID=A0ABP6FHW8_9ACTN
MFTQTINHTWHAAHSLPHLGGKCSSLHGHTWRVSITIAAPSLSADGILVDFAALKKPMTTWIDNNLDHALMLGAGDNLIPLLDLDGAPSTAPLLGGKEVDGAPGAYAFTPLAAAFAERGQRLFVFGRDFPDVAWPTVEGVAQLLAHKAHGWLTEASSRADVYVASVTVHETDRSSATWHNTDPHPAPGYADMALLLANQTERVITAVDAHLDQEYAALIGSTPK